MPVYGPYVVQLARTYRFFDRARAARQFDLRTEPKRLNDLEDNLWAFFQNCWHIKDWIRYDAGLEQATRDEIWDEVRKNHTLQIVADIANGTKHFELERPWTQTELAPIQVTRTPDGRWTIKHRIRLEDGTEVAAIHLAEQAMDEWQAILKGHDLAYFT